LMRAKAERADDADTILPYAAPAELRERRLDRRWAAPGDARLGRQPTGEGHMVVVLDEEGILPSGRDDAERLGRDRPARQPGDGGAAAVGAVEDEMVDLRLHHRRLDGRAAPRRLGRGEARILGLQDR